ncbi:N-formylglutamate amidohydrolase [Aestuariibius insulae]|uniref:N-formylglutamate amidohydrolase n=1 Tax=Aestuariibius insulae TaxID=2058287 RepID=UPI00345E5032
MTPGHRADYEPRSGAAVYRSTVDGRSSVLLVCEHASRFIPEDLNGLGLPENLLEAHIAWDRGAFGVAARLSERLDAPLLSGGISRLVYDCNRPPTAEDAIPVVSEVHEIPGNNGLLTEAILERIDEIYRPFHAGVEAALEEPGRRVLVTVHSFTPVYRGVPRAVEIGVLHGADARLADALLDLAPEDLRVERNAPYGPEDGVLHTLEEHAGPRGLLNAMIEIRSDLIESPKQQDEMAGRLADWLEAALARCEVPAC